MEINRLETHIAKVLRVGVLISGILMLIGWCLSAMDGSTSLFIFKDYDQISLIDQLNIAIANKQWSLVVSFFGISLLIALPVLRVALTSFLFFKQNEKDISLITFIVLVLLIISFYLGVKS